VSIRCKNTGRIGTLFDSQPPARTRDSGEFHAVVQVRAATPKAAPARGALEFVPAMPTYTYECKKCGHLKDVFHGMNEAPRVRCEECKGACRRLLGRGAGLIFKGSGFYETDYKRSGNGKGEKAGEKAGESAKSEGAKSEAGKSEGAKSEGGSSEGGKSEGKKSESAKSDSAATKRSDSGKASSSSAKKRSRNK
ncbi:MAG: FmdB family zinc ribbon protein, partial [Candidatus Hydrogenedentales bacterium]